MTEATQNSLGEMTKMIIAALIAGVASFLTASTTFDRDLSVAVATLDARLVSIEARIITLDEELDRVQDTRFSDRDASRLEVQLQTQINAESRSVRVAIDEIRRRVIRLERLETGGDLDGVPNFPNP